jgi:hypothetical protein
MGFYLPGIGEAIGGALRMKRQNELMEQSQTILKDETKPWSERVALVTAAHPELATNPQLQQMLETGRQADADKMQRTKYDQEQATVTENAQFKSLYDKQSPEGKAAMLQNNPDMVSRVYPEIYKQHSAQQAAAAKEAEWMKHNQITSGQADARAQVAADAQQGKNFLTMFAGGLVDEKGQVIPKATRDAQAADAAVALDAAKKGNTQQVALEQQQREAVPLVSALEAYRDAGAAEGGTGGFGQDNATLTTQRNLIVAQIAKQIAGPGLATSQKDVETAEQMVPEPSFFTTEGSFKAAMQPLIEQTKAKAGAAIPPPPPGFKVTK